MQMKSVDIRIVKSRALILDALLELMKDKAYAEISITELAEEACVARQTIYRNFSGKDEILLHYMDGVFDGYFRDIVDMMHRKEYIGDMSMSLLRIWKENKKLFLALQGAGLIHKTLERFSQYALMLQKHLDTRSGKKSVHHAYAAHFIAGGTYMVLSKWFQDNMKVPVEEMGDLFSEIGRFALEIIRR
ncbi:MAG: TetR/AcrR family transcriptional regulator [Spirochaetes bacterium]|nr:TetR/AcrR family transcriptional regulator [Spirochaetota bacterium]